MPIKCFTRGMAITYLVCIILMSVSAVGLSFGEPIPIPEEPTISVTQSVPTTFVNDQVGQEYILRLENVSTFSAENLAIMVTVNDTQTVAVSPHFSYVGGSLQVLLNGLTDLSAQAEVTGTGPFTITFTPAIALNPGDRLELTYRLATDSAVAAGSLNVLQAVVSTSNALAEEYSYIDEEPILVKTGQLVVELLPISSLPLKAYRGEQVTLEARLTNIGEGVYFFNPNEFFGVEWQSGFAQPQLKIGEGNVTPVLVGNSYQYVVSELAPGASYTFQLVLDVEGYQNFGLQAYFEDINGVRTTEGEEFTLLFQQPQVNVQVIKQPILRYGIDPATSSDTMEIQISNTSLNGTVRNFKLRTDLDTSLVTVTDLSPGWSFDTATKTFLYDTAHGGIIAGGQSVNLLVTLTPHLTPTALENKCALHEEFNDNNSKSYELTLVAEYTNDLNKLFQTPLVTTTYVFNEIPTILLTLARLSETADQDTRRVFLNEELNLRYTASITDVSKWDNTEKITFETSFPSVFLFDETDLTVTAGSVVLQKPGDGSQKILWQMTPAEAVAGQSITIYVTLTGDPTKAGVLYSTPVSLSGQSVAGCVLVKNAWPGYYLQSGEVTQLVSEMKTITNLPAEKMFDVSGKDNNNRVDYAIHYEFGLTSPGIWTDSTYTDTLYRNQNYAAGTAEYKDQNGLWAVVPPESIVLTSPLTIDLTFLRDVYGSDQISGKTLDLRYSLTLTNESFLSTDSFHRFTNFYEFICKSDLVITNAVGGDVTPDGKHHFYQGVFVPVSRARMNLEFELNKTTIAKGEVIKGTVTVEKISPWDNNNFHIIIDPHGNYAYQGNPGYEGFNGQIPTVTLEDVDSDGEQEIKFTFAQPLDGGIAGELGTVKFDLVKTGTDGVEVDAIIRYEDGLGYAYSHVQTAEVDNLLAGSLDLLVIPALVDVTSENATWTYEVVNMSAGIAYQTYLVERLEDIVTLTTSTVDGIVTIPQVEAFAGYKVIQWDLGNLLPGQSKRVVVNATIGTGNIADFQGTSTAEARYGWRDVLNNYTAIQTVLGNNGGDCPAFRTSVEASATFMKNEDVPAINLEESGLLKLRVENNGKSHNYNLEIRQNLGSAFIYQSGTAKINGVAIANPQISGTEMIWTFDSSQLHYLPELVEMVPGEVFTIEYQVKSTEGFTAQNLITSSATWQLPWERGGATRSGSTIGAEYAVPRNLPEIHVVVDGRNQTTNSVYSNDLVAVMNDVIEWRIQITNSGAATARNVLLQNTLPPNSRFEEITGTGPMTIVVDGASWNIGDIAPGNTAIYKITATFIGPCMSTQLDTASVRWGETYSLTTPGTPTDSARLITQPIISQLSEKITDFTTKQGHVVITLRNTGAPMYDVKLTNDLTQRFELADVTGIIYSASLSGAGLTQWPLTGTDGNAPLSWQWAGPIPAGTHMIEFDLRDANLGASDGSAIIPNLSLTYNNSGGVTQPVAVENTTSFDPGQAILTVDFSHETQINNGAIPVTYTITVTNTGDAEATDVEMVDTLGAGYTILSATPVPDMQDSNTLTWSHRVIPPNSSLTLTVQANVNPLGNHLQTAVAKEMGYASVVSQGEDTISTAVFSFEKSLDQTTGNGNDPLADTAGETLNYTIRANFLGDELYENVVIKDILPQGIELMDVTVPAEFTGLFVQSVSDKTISWSFQPIQGPKTVDIQYVGRII